MGLKVFWTDFALNQLEQIFDFYKYKAGVDGSDIWVSSVFDCRQNPIKMIQ